MNDQALAVEQSEGDSAEQGLYNLTEDQALEHIASMDYDDEPESEVKADDEIEDQERVKESESEDEESESKEEDQPQPEDEDQPDTTDLPSDDLVIAADGETKVTLGELRESYAKAQNERAELESLTTKKSQELTEVVKRTEDYEQKAIAHYQTVLNGLQSGLNQIDSNTDWNGLKATDFGAYQTKVAERNQLEQQVQSVSKQAEALLSESQSAKAERDQAQAKQAVDYLQTNINGWNQDAYNKVASFAEKQGIASDEFLNIRSGPVIRLIHDQMRALEAKDKALASVMGKSPQEKAPKQQKKDSRTQRQRQIDKLTQRVKKGDHDAAIELMMLQPKQ